LITAAGNTWQETQGRGAGSGRAFSIPTRTIPEMVNSAQTSEGHETTKVTALKEAQRSRKPRFTRVKEKA